MIIIKLIIEQYINIIEGRKNRYCCLNDDEKRVFKKLSSIKGECMWLQIMW